MKTPFRLCSAALALVATASTPLADATPQIISSLPKTISSPGVYCVDQDLTGVSGSDGITIASPNVTLDLGGYALNGVSGAGIGIQVVSSSTGIVIRNGRLVDWPSHGILGSLGRIRAENVHTVRSGGVGIFLIGSGVVERCTSTDDGGGGISVGDSSHVADCTVFVGANGPTSAGYNLGAGTLGERLHLRPEVFASSHVETATGFLVGAGVTLKECRAVGGLGRGFFLEQGSTAIRCSVDKSSTGEVQTGFEVSPFGRAIDCYAERCVLGYQVDRNATVERCVSASNDTHGMTLAEGARAVECTVVLNDGDGIQADTGAIVDGCSVRDNDGHGIVTLGGAARLSWNTVADNGVDGIHLGDEAIAMYNICSGNAVAGIRAAGDRCRIENNTTDANANGVVAEGKHNLLAGNRAIANTVSDFVLAPKNPAGPVLTTSSWLNNASPFANFRTPFF